MTHQVLANTVNVEHEPTLNKCGYMHPLSKTGKQFIHYASNMDLPVVDLGCAYGIVSIEAANAGASQVFACDIEERHLRILENRAIKAGVDSQITTMLGKFPYTISFKKNTIGAVLASLVLAYLTIEELERGLENIFTWLAPGGKLFIISYSIHIKEFTNQLFQAEYQRRVDGLERWPGYFDDFNKYSTIAEDNINGNIMPIKLHFFEMVTLVQALKRIGFEIEVAEYLDGKNNGAIREVWCDGREMIGVIVKKPNFLRS